MVLTNPVRIYYKSPPEIMNIVRDLREHGLRQGIDFDFVTYTRGGYVTFYFKEGKYGTFYNLKYSRI